MAYGRYVAPVAAVLGVGAVWSGNAAGLWWITPLAGLAIGLALRRGRAAFGVAALAGPLGWGLPLGVAALSLLMARVASLVAGIMVLGLAPAAHGGNRTGRIFTGDRSGDWLFAALWRAGLASQPESIHRDDGLQLRDCYVTAAVRCAPPGNRPLPSERDRCLPYLGRELRLLRRAAVVVCLGGFAWDAAMRGLVALGVTTPRPRPRFGHGVAVPLGPYTLLGSYHPSQQNTFTGRPTEAMLDEVFAQAKALAPPSTLSA